MVSRPKGPLVIFLLFSAAVARMGMADEAPPPASPSGGPDLSSLPAIDLSAPGEQVGVGDTVEFRIDLKSNPDPRLSAIEPKNSVIAAKDSDALNSTDSDELSDAGWTIENEKPKMEGEFRFLAVPVKSGSLTLPALILKDSSTGNPVARTNPFKLSVMSAIEADDPKPNEPVELLDPAKLRFPWEWIVAGGVLAILLMAGIVYGLIRLIRSRRERRKLPTAPPVPVKSEDEMALEALNALVRRNLAASGAFKPHYFGISEILKAYLGARYRFDALESTSGEIISLLESRPNLPRETVNRISDLFTRLDRVKFTDHVPDPTEAKSLVEEGRAIIQMTKRHRPKEGPHV